MQFDVALTAPTNNETIDFQPPSQAGPSVDGSIAYRVQWTCSSNPAPVRLSWELYWNNSVCDSGAVDVNWSDNMGEVNLTPSYVPLYNYERSGANVFKLAVTDQFNFQDASVDCTVVPV